MFELWVWIATLFATAIAHIALYYKWHSMEALGAAVPRENAIFSKRLAITNGINYLGFGILAVFCLIFYSQFLPSVIVVLREWWIVEVFILWNLRTTALIFLGLRKIKVNL